jgi:hypothetical protein
LITITLNKIRARSPCESGWKKLLKAKAGVGMDEEFPLADVLDSNGLDDALWCLRCLPQHDKTWRLFAVWCARQVQHLITDQRSLDALDVAERHAHGLATDEELAAARAAAVAAAVAAAWDAARAARDAARDAAWAAAGAAARDAARDARDAAGAAAWHAARASQEKKLREMIND